MHNIPSNTFSQIDALVNKTKRSEEHADGMIFPLHRTQMMIDIMERVKSMGGGVHMTNWYTNSDGRALKVNTDVCLLGMNDYHKCGNAACFAGWVSLSPEWRAFFTNGPQSPCDFSMAAFWIGVDSDTISPAALSMSCKFVFGDRMSDDESWGNETNWSRFYNRYWHHVDANDVLAKLHEIKEKTIKANQYYS